MKKTTKTSTKKQTTKKCCPSKEKVYEEIHELGDKLMDLAKTAKTKYKKADPKTQKKIIASVAGATALIAGVIGVKKAIKKKK